MGQKILVAFCESTSALKAVAQTAKFLSTDGKITLFSVIPDSAGLCETKSRELTPYYGAQQASMCESEDRRKSLLVAAIERAKRLLLEAGFDAGRIEVKLEMKKEGVAKDIVAEAQSGYDLIVMGRSASSGIKGLFLGGICRKVLVLAKQIPVLVVNES
jgi:nucleotide-binding universal stress UspA family protein